MKNIISFLEELGKNADLRLDRVDFESILNNDDFDPEARNAILNKDQQALEMILDARSKIVCLLVPAEEDEDDDKDDKDEEDSKNVLSKKSLLAKVG
jgi:hypothetical protein